VRELSRTMSYVERYETPAAVVYFDVNDLKKINDTFGHATGDAALMHVARLLEDNIRDTDTVGRLGGDEFGVILSHADEAQAAEKGAALAKVIEDTPFRWQDKLLRLSVSLGSYSFRSAGDPAHALDAADRQMYLRKKGVVRD
ncbi:MAG: GGDEF domain-containing protein, partial [Alphaproteobacteria bacterium]